MALEKRKRLLVIFPGALGDLICALPAIRVLAKRHPDADLELMARAELARFALSRLGAVHAHSIDRREIGHLFVRSLDLAEARAFFGGFEHIYSFFASDNSDFRSCLAAVSTGTLAFVPFRPEGGGHIAISYLREVEASAIEEEDILTLSRVTVLPEDLDAADDLLAAIGLRQDDFLLLLPGSGSPSKNWPPEHFADLASLIAPKLPSVVVIGPAEAPLAPFFHTRNLLVVDQLDLGTVAGLACRARCFVGNDSGVAHLAARAGAPGVAIFGPTKPGRWRPLGKVQVLQHEPLSDLLPDQVAAHLLKLNR
jgi:heptosyltransferase III